ncbi:MAG: hypothetical protein VYA30_07470 [Myxococcota bacterium]|nr:hypothetical protein [Myxococcota bacterium]
MLKQTWFIRHRFELHIQAVFGPLVGSFLTKVVLDNIEDGCCVD